MAHCHDTGLKLAIPENVKKIVLAGNPNTGKSVFFNYLTGLYVDVSNYPGTTLEISHGKMDEDVIIDTPGVYGLSSFNDEEKIARDIIINADIVLNVVDAVHLERDLFLTQQIIDTGVPVVVALNMVDEAKRQGIEIDYQALSSLLGVPVIPTVAIKGQGLEKVKNTLHSATKGRITPGLKKSLTDLINRVGSQGEALLVLEGDEVVASRHGILPGKERDKVYMERRKRVNEITAEVLKEVRQGASFATTLGRLMIKPVTGIPILALALWLMYKAIGVFVAQDIVGITEETIMIGMYEPAIKGLISKYVTLDSILGQFLAGEFGILTMAPTYLLGLLMPLVVGFYFFLALFEDSGYLPRIATLTDRVLSSLGLNGRAVIPMILGFGCVTMATIVTRILGSDRERRIAIFLLGLTIPCSAQLGVIVGLLAGVGIKLTIMYIVVIFSMLVAAGTILNAILPGKSTDLLIDLPPLRIPRLANVLKKTGVKSYGFLKEAAPLFALGAIIITGLQVTGTLEVIQNLLAPITVGWLGLPKEAATAFVMGIVRRDFGAAGLTSLSLTSMQTVVALITITLFVPCIASIMVLFKERSKKEAAIIWSASLVVAFIAGGTVARLANIFSTGNEVNIFAVTIAFVLLSIGAIAVTKISRKKLFSTFRV